jgi:hypothetical protein
MRPFARTRKWILVLWTLVLVSVLSIWIEERLNRLRARDLVAAMQTVRVGASSLPEVESLARQFGGVARQPCDASLCNVDFGPIRNSLLAKLHLAPATRLGSRITVQDGTVSYMTVGYDVTSPARTIASADVFVFPIIEERAFPAGGAPFEVNVRWGASGSSKPDKRWKIGVRMTPAAPQELQRAAFAFDLSCLTRLGGCTSGDELLPGIAGVPNKHIDRDVLQ